MTTPLPIIDSPTEWVADHITRYVETNGEDGHMWRGVPTLLLTTTGRKSGALRRTALIYGTLGSDYLLVASKGGFPTHPLWYTNLEADAVVTLQVGADVFQARASTMPEGAERDAACNRWLISGQTLRCIKQRLSAEFHSYDLHEFN